MIFVELNGIRAVYCGPNTRQYVETLSEEQQDKKCTYNVTLKCVHATFFFFCSGRSISITYSECVFVVLDIHHAMRMRRSHLWTARLYHIIST
jgi:hypothetical protein